MSEPRAYTREEIRDMFMKQAVALTRYWSTTNLRRDFASKEDEIKDRCEGVLFSILALLDGADMAIPGFAVVPQPHEDDMEDRRQNGENWFPPLPAEIKTQLIDISGGLHDMFHRYAKD